QVRAHPGARRTRVSLDPGPAVSRRVAAAWLAVIPLGESSLAAVPTVVPSGVAASLILSPQLFLVTFAVLASPLLEPFVVLAAVLVEALVIAAATAPVPLVLVVGGKR